MIQLINIIRRIKSLLLKPVFCTVLINLSGLLSLLNQASRLFKLRVDYMKSFAYLDVGGEERSLTKVQTQ